MLTLIVYEENVQHVVPDPFMDGAFDREENPSYAPRDTIVY